MSAFSSSAFSTTAFSESAFDFNGVATLPASGTLQDFIKAKTSGNSVNTGLAIWFSKLPSETLSDAEFRWLGDQGASGNTVQDRWKSYLIGLGYSGTLMDMMKKYWSS
jgi:hypothetical protein